MKKLLSAVLVLSMLMSMSVMLTGASAETELTPVNFLVAANSATSDMNEWPWINEMAEEHGLDVEWTMMYTGWSEKRAAMLAAGETYDAYFGWRVFKSSEILANADMFYDMSPIVSEAAPAMAGLLETDSTLAGNMVQADGSILYATTDKFLEHFGISDIRELPPLPDPQPVEKVDEPLTP